MEKVSDFISRYKNTDYIISGVVGRLQNGTNFGVTKITNNKPK